MARQILVVDDDEAVRDFLVRVLGSSGAYNVTPAKGGKEGLELAMRIRPDLVVLDINMPDIDGFEVLKRLKENDLTVGIPVIMLSGRSDDETKERAASLYNEAYLTKPVDIKALRACVENTLDRTRTGNRPDTG